MPMGKPLVVNAEIDADLREITKALTLALEDKVEAQLGTRPWPEQQSAKIFAAMGVLAQVVYRTTRRDSIEETLRAVSVTLADLLKALVVASSQRSGKA